MSQSISIDGKSVPLTSGTEVDSSSLVMKTVAALCLSYRDTFSLGFSSSLLFDSFIKNTILIVFVVLLVPW